MSACSSFAILHNFLTPPACPSLTAFLSLRPVLVLQCRLARFCNHRPAPARPTFTGKCTCPMTHFCMGDWLNYVTIHSNMSTAANENAGQYSVMTRYTTLKQRPRSLLPCQAMLLTQKFSFGSMHITGRGVKDLQQRRVLRKWSSRQLIWHS